MYPTPRTVLSIGGLRRGDAQDEAAAADHTANIGRGSESRPEQTNSNNRQSLGLLVGDAEHDDLAIRGHAVGDANPRDRELQRDGIYRAGLVAVQAQGSDRGQLSQGVEQRPPPLEPDRGQGDGRLGLEPHAGQGERKGSADIGASGPRHARSIERLKRKPQS